MRNSKTKLITLGAVYTALSVVFIFLTGTIPVLELTFLAIASAMPAIMIIEAGPIGGFLVYLATSTLGFFIVPNKIAILPYIFLFGIYGIIKYYAEKPQNPIIQMVIKGVYFASALTAFKEIVFENIIVSESDMGGMLLGLSFPLFFAVAVVIFLIYDYIYTLGINWYMKKFKRGNKF